MNNPAKAQQQGSSSIILAIFSIVLGICGFIGMVPTILFTLCGVIPIAFGIGAIVLGLLAFVRARRDNAAGGIKVAGIIGAVIGVLAVIAPIAYTVFIVGLSYWLSSTR